MTLSELFKKNTSTRTLNDGCTRIKCKRGLWSVEGLDKHNVRQEAERYFWQYYLDGEYRELSTTSVPRFACVAGRIGWTKEDGVWQKS